MNYWMLLLTAPMRQSQIPSVWIISCTPGRSIRQACLEAGGAKNIAALNDVVIHAHFERGMKIFHRLGRIGVASDMPQSIVDATAGICIIINQLGQIIAHNFEAEPVVQNNVALSAGKVLAPFVRYQGTYTHQDEFTETGAGGLNLTGASSNYNAASIIAGISFGGEHKLENGTFQGEITIAYERAVDDVLPTASLSFTGSPTSFNVNGPLEYRDCLRLGVNADFGVSENTSFGVDVVSLLSKDRVEYSAIAKFKIRF